MEDPGDPHEKRVVGKFHFLPGLPDNALPNQSKEGLKWPMKEPFPDSAISNAPFVGKRLCANGGIC